MKVLIDNNSYKSFKKAVRHYYKYSYDTFTQPILTNGNQPLGSNAFAIYAADYYSDHYPWHAFDEPSDNTFWSPLAWNKTTNPEYIIMYNPNPIQVTKLTMTNAGSIGNRAMVTGSIDASNDGENWTTVMSSWNNTVQTKSASWDIDLPSNVGYFKYYRLNVTEWKYYNPYTKAVANIQITATEKVATESTSSDYDFYKDIDVYESLV